MLIGDRWVDGTGDSWITVDDPATEEAVGRVPAGSAADVDLAVAAASGAFDGWRWTAAGERAALLQKAAAKSEEHAADLLELLTREQGKPRSEQEEELEYAVSCLRYYAELGRSRRGTVIPSGEPRTQLNLVLREPYGVVGAIVPWNYPLLLLSWKLAPALAAGNAVVVKPSEWAPLATVEWIRRCFDHFPPGVINVVTGDGSAGRALVAHPGVPLVAFTGSVETGRHIASVAAPMMKRLHLELGGKDAFVVAPDADPSTAADAVAYAALINAGQVCTSAERVYVPSGLHDEVVAALEARVSSLRLGHGLEEGVDMGPMMGEPFRGKVERHIAEAVDRGARVVTGGRRPRDRDRGWFYEPTVLIDVDHDMAIMRDETFGPAIPVMTYTAFSDAIALVNDSPMGLGATLRSTDPVLVKRFFEEVKVGTVWINDPLTDNDAGPFGGMKLSGGARELGEQALDEFSETKHVHWDLSDAPKDWWYPY
ncbi:MAG: aldehyde dehydrogenase [Euzebyales bacterium]|nr:aldehyde dehydrogenase [Euzebyales bacterium]